MTLSAQEILGHLQTYRFLAISQACILGYHLSICSSSTNKQKIMHHLDRLIGDHRWSMAKK